VEVRCHRCQATNPPGAAWCNQCATRFEPAMAGQRAGPPATWPAPVGPGWGEPGHVAPEKREPVPPDLAGVWPRIGARLLDALLVSMAVGVLAALLSLPDNLGLLLTLVAMVSYETLMLASGGQTLAKSLLRIRVMRADRAPLTPRDALVRSAVIELLWIVPLGWPIAAALLERQRRRQGPHDRAAGTLVVVARPSP
jgi:uncharacterized RDD family membrane protein YckC